jgi:hypothetical protein
VSYETVGWKDFIVGESYLSLYPKDIHVTPQAALHAPVARCFQTGMLTLNFHNNYHLDQRDRNIPTHCSFSPPSNWVDDPSSSRNTVFGMGSVIADISKNAQRISFLPQQVKHCTSEPTGVPSLPFYLQGNCSTSTLLKHQNEFYSFVSKSMLAWGGWGWWSTNANRTREYDQVVEGVVDPAERREIRRDLRDYWARMGYTRVEEEVRYEREVSRRRRRRNDALRRNAQRRQQSRGDGGI